MTESTNGATTPTNPLDAEAAIAAIGEQMKGVLEATASAKLARSLGLQQPTVPANAPPLPSEPPEDASGDTDEEEEEVAPAPTVSSDQDTDDEEDASPPRTWRVKADDAEFEATEEEVLRLASAGKNYTRRSQELAAQKKAFAEHEQAVRAERAKYAEQLAVVEAQIQALKPQEPDWAYLRANDPNAYAIAVADWTRLQVEEQKVKDKRVEAQAKVQADRQAEAQEQAKEREARLLEIIPEWRKPDVAQRELTAMYEFAKAKGMSDTQIRVVASDPVAVAMFRDGWRYTQSQKAKPAVEAMAERKVQAVKAMSPGSAQAPQTASKRALKEGDRLVNRLKATGSVSDAASVFAKMFPDE